MTSPDKIALAELLPENADERRMFDDLCASMGWTPLQQIANRLFMERNLRSAPGASYYEQHTIAFNELNKAAALLRRPVLPHREALEQARLALTKIRACSIAGCEYGYGKPEIWADALFASHGDVANALKTIDAALQSAADTVGRERLALTVLQEIIENWNNLKRDEGAFPTGDRRAAMSEHRLWHSIQTAKAVLAASPSPAQSGAEREEVETLLNRNHRYLDAFAGRNKLHCGPHMLNHALIESTELIERLTAPLDRDEIAREEVQDTWFTDSRLPIMAMSGDVESDRVLKLHFRRKVTDADRARLVEVLNAGERVLSPASGGGK